MTDIEYIGNVGVVSEASLVLLSINLPNEQGTIHVTIIIIIILRIPQSSALRSIYGIEKKFS